MDYATWGRLAAEKQAGLRARPPYVVAVGAHDAGRVPAGRGLRVVVDRRQIPRERLALLAGRQFLQIHPVGARRVDGEHEPFEQFRAQRHPELPALALPPDGTR